MSSIREELLVQTIQKALENPYDIGWLAGIIDADGTVAIGKSCGKWLIPIIQVKNKDVRVIERCISIIGEGCYVTKPGGCYQLKVNGMPNMYSLLLRITPHMTRKRRQAELLLEYLKSRLSKRPSSPCQSLGKTPYTKRELEIYEEIKRLNHALRGGGDK